MMNLAASQAYPRLPGYLNTATVGIPPHAAVEALAMAAAQWGTGETDPVAADRAIERARGAYARIVGSQPDRVAIAGSVSQVTGMVAASLPNDARVLTVRGDFTSVLFPFMADPRLEVETVELDALADSIREGVDLVAFSSVQSADGRVADLAAVAEAAARVGATTYVDASQAAGWLPLDATMFDIVVAGGYKWLGTPRGVAYAAVNERATWLRPVYANWYAADEPWNALYGPPLRLSDSGRRWDSSPSWQLAEAAAISLETVAGFSRAEVHDHSVRLANALRAGLGMPASDSAIVSASAAGSKELERAGVRAATRAGQARLGFYLYNDMEDVEAALHGLVGAGVHAA